MGIYSKYAIYTGNFVNGKRSGQGKMVYNDPEHVLEWLGETEGEYNGLWKDDQRHGQGLMIWPNGLKYDGRFNCDKRHHVTGKLYFLNGNVYDGGWVDDKMQGVGCVTTPSGIRFTSRFIAGISENVGVLEIEGNVYEGECENMQPHGRGKYRLQNGDVYEGNMHFGIIEGYGKLSYANGGVYTGEMSAGSRHGKGKMVYSNGFLYDGRWIRDKREGFGVFFDKNGGKVYSGEWKEDRQEGKGIIKRIKIKNVN